VSSGNTAPRADAAAAAGQFLATLIVLHRFGDLSTDEKAELKKPQGDA
jgi:hypothetical protein